MTERWMVHNLTRAIALIVLISVVCAPAVAHETSPDNSESGHRDRGEAGDRDRCAEITSQYTINDAITGATPHWVFLTLVQEDRQHLLDFIDSLVVPDAKKAEWKSILEDLWKKYPVDVKEGKNSLQITLKRGTPSIKLTAYEEAVLGEIDDAIAHAMEESLNSEISPMWNPDAHNQIFSSSCSSQNTGPLLFRYCIPEITDKAAEPDNWCSGNFACQMLNHGYLPSINFGLAPDNLERNATEASNKINSGEYMSGFGSLAHASHFLADIGNPLHTGEAINQIADLGMVHHAYEDYVKKNWNTLLLGADRSFSDYVTGTTDIRWNSDPLQSGRRLAGDSTLSSDALYRYIYRTFIRYDRFLPEADPRIADITIKSLVETKQYTNGLVTYATRGARIFTIRADTRPHGTVSPSGSVRVLYKTDQTFTITPDANFVISDVTVDGQSVGAVSSYTFPPVDRDHRIRATFERGFFTITPSAGSNGQISPSSPVTVPRGESQIFTITSNPGYRVRDVVVDGNSIGPVVSYTFTNVQDDHRIRATFRQTQATFTITPSAGPHGTITPSMAVTVPYAGSTTFTITPDSGYVIDQVLVDGVTQGAVPSYTFAGVLSDHTIGATFRLAAPPTPGIVPLCPAGTPFDASKYSQNWPRSDPMIFSCNWDGTGQVYISGDKNAVTGIWSDDGFTISIQPSGADFETPTHKAIQHPPIDLTGGMRPGENTLTLVVQNWQELSMSYGSKTGIGIDQTPYIIQVNSPAAYTEYLSTVKPERIESTTNESFENANEIQAETTS